MSIMNDIRACLDNHLATATGLPAIAFQNVPYQQVTGTPYIKATMVPTLRRPATRGINPQQLYQGLYRLTICTPENVGSGANYDIVDAVLLRFDATTDISYNGYIVSVDYAEVGTSYLDSPFYCTPVNVGWYIYRS